MIREAIKIIAENNDLDSLQMACVMEEIMSGKAETPEIVSFLKALSQKGETVKELIAAVKVMRKHAIKINSSREVLLDTCGTGGDARGTFNVSTIVAFVASGSGIAVAKHGNRSVSSRCGSADILEALSIDINMPYKKIEKCLDDIGIAFLFAQNLHPAMKYAMPARREIGKRTIFNLIGPLSNPAQATHQLIGVFDKKWVGIFAEVLLNLGSTHALVVHGKDGLDEITTSDNTDVAESNLKSIKTYEINPQDFGFNKSTLDDLAGGGVADNVKILLEILKGVHNPKRDIVVLNSAAAIYVAGSASSIKEGIKKAEDSIDSGKALKKLELLQEFSKKG
ncbi:MAG: anthranilate phosphoribosyltransferase [Candidatus Omnitrophica bacterium]|nr:anthranilate phosphoribosyltransferase [Candidatus Omnitrophota bacterium]